MALFESYERRIDRINSVLHEYGIESIEDAKAICDAAGIDHGCATGRRPAPPTAPCSPAKA